MPRGDLSPAECTFHSLAAEIGWPYLAGKLGKKGLRLDNALKHVLKAEGLKAKLQEVDYAWAFKRLDAEPCIKGEPSWDNKTAKMAGLLLWFSTNHGNCNSPLKLDSLDGPYSKDLYLTLSPNASRPTAPASGDGLFSEAEPAALAAPAALETAPDA